MKLWKWMVAVSLLALFSACNSRRPEFTQTNTMPSNLNPQSPEITSESEEGFFDLVFRLQELKSLPDGSQSIRVAGLHKGRPVGFEVILNPSWKRGLLGNTGIETNSGTLTYRSIGKESDEFIQALDDIYGTKLGANVMADETTFTAISLEGRPGSLSDAPVKIKVFYEKGGEVGYAELFTNIDLNSRRVEIREKDPEYRKGIVRALRGG